MKDQVFTGKDVAEAVTLAERTLGIPAASIRYVVLDGGQAGTLGRADTPARIAVLLDAGSGPAAAGAARTAATRPQAAKPPRDYRASIREVLRSLATTAEVDLSAELQETEGSLTVTLEGDGRNMLLEDGAEPLRALEQVLQRILVRDGGPRRLIMRCEGYRDARGDALRDEALRLAAAVAADGRPRTTEPMNSYERRLVHVALADHPAVKTFSVGEGGDRRVTVALRSEGEPDTPEAG
jgi:spoIIIJ-associated protein